MGRSFLNRIIDALQFQLDNVTRFDQVIQNGSCSFTKFEFAERIRGPPTTRAAELLDLQELYTMFNTPETLERATPTQRTELTDLFIAIERVMQK